MRLITILGLVMGLSAAACTVDVAGPEDGNEETQQVESAVEKPQGGGGAVEKSCCIASRQGFEQFCADRDGSEAECTAVKDCAWADSLSCEPDDGIGIDPK